MVGITRCLRYELGGGAAQITSKDPVNDNQEHTVKLTRKGRSGKMFLDGKEAITGTSSGILAMLNVEGNIYLGESGARALSIEVKTNGLGNYSNLRNAFSRVVVTAILLLKSAS